MSLTSSYKTSYLFSNYFYTLYPLIYVYIFISDNENVARINLLLLVVFYRFYKVIILKTLPNDL